MTKKIAIMLMMACAWLSSSYAGYYSDEVHSGGNHHTVTWVLDPGEDFVALCKAWVAGHSVGDEFVKGCETGSGSYIGGYMCAKWENRNGWDCTGGFWYLQMSQCAPNTLYHPTYSCLPVITEVKDKPGSCSKFGNPIIPSRGQKTQSVGLGVAIGGISLEVSYNSLASLKVVAPPTNGATAPWVPMALPGFGPSWSLNVMGALRLQRDTWAQYIKPSRVLDGASSVSFNQASAGVYIADNYQPEELRTTNLSGYSDWVRRDFRGLILETLDSVQGDGNTKLPFTRAIVDGRKLRWVYSTQGDVPVLAPAAGLPMAVIDQFSRKLEFEYKPVGSSYKIARMRFAGADVAQFEYGAAENLIAIVWPDGARQQLHYEHELNSGLLTGVTDENGIRHSTFEYTADGFAKSTELAGAINRHEAVYTEPPRRAASIVFDEAKRAFIRTIYWDVKDVAVMAPSRNSVSLSSQSVLGYPEVTSTSQPAGSGCAASVRRQDFDAQGNLAWKEDFKGNRTCYAQDMTRNLETSRVEGLATNSACASILANGSVLPGNSRRTSTQWHPMWHLETKIAEPRRLTTRVYNGQPDPFSGGATASCAPANATLPDGSPIVVLCKQVEQATTDNNGALGFAATLAPTSDVPMRVQQWTYNEHGQVLTAKDPLNNTTTNGYYADTTADYTRGDLATVTNALNQVVARYTKYHPSGQWLEMLDANGIATTRTFDLRQRLKTSTTAGRTTTYDYWPTGLLKSVTLPDATAVQYGYDDAHRLTSVSDRLGNKITYTLDNSGNRIGEAVTDPTGKLAKTLTRVPDALNRIQQISGRE